MFDLGGILRSLLGQDDELQARQSPSQPQLQVRPAQGYQGSKDSSFAPVQGRRTLNPSQVSFPSLQGQSFGRGQAPVNYSQRTEDDALLYGQQGFAPMSSDVGSFNRFGNAEDDYLRRSRQGYTPMNSDVGSFQGRLRDLLRGLGY